MGTRPDRAEAELRSHPALVSCPSGMRALSRYVETSFANEKTPTDLKERNLSNQAGCLSRTTQHSREYGGGEDEKDPKAVS